MRVGIYLGRHFGAGGGIAQYSKGLLRNYLRILERRETRPHLCVYAESTILDSVNPATSSANASAVTVRKLPEVFGRKSGVLLDQLLLPFYATIDRLDLLHSTPNYGPCLAPAKMLVTIHDVFQAFPPEAPRTTPTMRFYRMLFRAQFPRLALAIADTPRVAAELLERYRLTPEKVRTIPLGIDDDLPAYLHDSAREKADAMLGALGIRPGYTLVFGSSDGRKNFRRALHAWLKLPPELRRRGLLVKGLDAEARRIAREEIPSDVYDREVRSVPWLERSELFALFVSAGAFLFPTLAEGFGFPALESLALGCPIVASNLDCLATAPKQGVHLCNPLEVDSIAFALRTALVSELSTLLVDNPAAVDERLQLARSAISSFPTFSSAAEQTFALYDSVLR